MILGVNTKPAYYISKRILWIDKKELLIVREEQYDRKGELWKILETGWLDKKKKYAPREPDIHYWTRVLWNIWNIKDSHKTGGLYIDLRYDKDSFLGWKGEKTPLM